MLVYLTGLGMTTPAVLRAPWFPAGRLPTAAVTATVGGQDARVAYSIASPGYAGLNQVPLRSPEGVRGTVPIVTSRGSAKSTAVMIPVM